MKQIVIDITEDGGVEIKAVGFKGSSCDKATEALEKALGLENASKKRTPEFYASETISQKVGGG